jgi:hypothetical protein
MVKSRRDGYWSAAAYGFSVVDQFGREPPPRLRGEGFDFGFSISAVLAILPILHQNPCYKNKL